MKTVLLIDSDAQFRQSFRDIFDNQDVDVIEAECPTTAYQKLFSMEPPDLIVGDLYMPFSTESDGHEYKTSYEFGLRTLHELAWVFPDKPVIALSSLGPSDLARLKEYLSPIPSYSKTDDITQVRSIVVGYLTSAEMGGVQ